MRFLPKIAAALSICLSVLACGGQNKPTEKMTVNPPQGVAGQAKGQVKHPFVLADGVEFLNQTQREIVENALTGFATKFPRMMTKILENGFKVIVFEKTPGDQTEGAVLAEVQVESKRIVIYSAYFEAAKIFVNKDNSTSMAELALLHEFLHAFDADNAIVSVSYPLLGWDRKENLSADHAGFEIETPTALKNVWIPAAKVAEIKTKVTPILKEKGPIAAFFAARQLSKKFGYPTIYSVLGGPGETFAELGAYIALDSEARAYVKPATSRWYEENILK